MKQIEPDISRIRYVPKDSLPFVAPWLKLPRDKISGADENF